MRSIEQVKLVHQAAELLRKVRRETLNQQAHTNLVMAVEHAQEALDALLEDNNEEA